MGALLAERLKGSFVSLRDLMTRVELGEGELKTLIKVGALDRIGGDRSRRQLLWQLGAWQPTLARQRSRIGGEKAPARQESMPLAEFVLGQADQLPDAPEYTPQEKARLEEHYLGFTIATRPLDFYAAELAKHKPIPSHELAQHIGASIVLAGRPIAGRRHITKQGQWLLFLSLEDNSGIMELVLFPAVYSQYAAELRPGGPYLVRGTIESPHPGELTIIVEKIRSLNRLSVEEETEMAGSGELGPVSKSS
jgi:DNA polymerase III alpha subunit